MLCTSVIGVTFTYIIWFYSVCDENDEYDDNTFAFKHVPTT